MASTQTKSRGSCQWRIFYFQLIITFTIICSVELRTFEPKPRYGEPFQDVIFEKVGTFIGSATFVHTHIQIPTRKFMAQLDDLIYNLGMYNISYTTKINDPNYYHSETDVINKEIVESAIRSLKIIYSDMQEQILNFPRHRLDKRQIDPLGIILGGVGTIWGFFNSHQIANIKQAVLDVKNRQDLIIEVAKLNTQHIDNLEIQTDAVTDALNDLLLNNPAKLLHKINEAFFKVQRSANVINKAIQQAMNHKLSTTLLSSSTLNQIFNGLHDRAIRLDSKLLIEHPSDLYQLECSYVIDANDTISLIVHTPMAQKSQLLNLHQYIPLPLSQSFDSNITLTPKLDNNLLASGPKYEYKTLSQTELSTCTKLGQNFFSNGRDVIHTDLHDTCLGALFLRQIPGVLKHCQFQIEELKEKVVPIGQDQYIIISPIKFEAIKRCDNGHYESISVDHVTKITIEEGCIFQTKLNIIQPDINVKDDLTISFRSMDWNIDQLFPNHNISDLQETFQKLRKSGTHVITKSKNLSEF